MVSMVTTALAFYGVKVAIDNMQADYSGYVPKNLFTKLVSGARFGSQAIVS